MTLAGDEAPIVTKSLAKKCTTLSW